MSATKFVEGSPNAFSRRESAENAHIVIVPLHAQHVAEADALSAVVYDHEIGYRVDSYHSALHIFPEGQFVALDCAAGGRVVGLTSGMRTRYTPGEPITQSWSEATGYG